MALNTFWNETIHGLIPHPGNFTLDEEVECYSLPYGGIGFAGHLLTYWTVASLIIGRRPWQIWKSTPLSKRWFNVGLEATSLVLTLVTSILALVKCLGAWQFVLMAVWKMTLAVSLAAIALHRAWTLPKDTESFLLRRVLKRNQSSGTGSSSLNNLTANPAPPGGMYQQVPTSLEGNGFGYSSGFNGTTTMLAAMASAEDLTLPVPKPSLIFWLTLYLVGTLLGLTGLFSIVHARWPENDVQLIKITCVFVGLAFGPAALYISVAVLIGTLGRKFTGGQIFALVFGHVSVCGGIFVIWVGIVSALFSDWALGSIMGNLAGVPSTSNWVIYVIYFVGKRLPFFSF